MTAAFLECSTFLKKFLAGFLRSQQDIEEVAQETYLRAYIAEQRETIEQPKAFLFRIAKNLALTRALSSPVIVNTYGGSRAMRGKSVRGSAPLREGAGFPANSWS